MRFQFAHIMGRRGTMRGQPKFLLVMLLAVCLIGFFMPWKSLTSSNSKYTKRSKLYAKIDKWRSEKYQFKDHLKHLTSNGNSKRESVTNMQRNELAIKTESAEDKTTATKPDALVVNSNGGKATLNKTNDFYRGVNKVATEIMASMEKFVHLDLKGAAPKMAYLEAFISMIAKLGATGLLIEYEDMFPYKGVLENITSPHAYSMDAIVVLLKLASQHKLKVMPLIQTFGHMEFVLKSEFASLRKSFYENQIIDTANDESYKLISEMVKQILKVHSNITHLHIGCGHPYKLLTGASATGQHKIKPMESVKYLTHVKRVADIVRKQSSSNVMPVIWDNMLRKMSLSDNSDLAPYLEIMVGQYSANVSQINQSVWKMYATAYKSIWVASAFKGMTGVRQLYTEPKKYILNQLSWIDVIAENQYQLKFKGIALMGQQRHNHFSTLCELLPVAFPSLALCLATIKHAGFTKDIHLETGILINCRHELDLTFSKPGINRALNSRDCQFPGRELYYSIKLLHGHKISNSATTNLIDGWLSDFRLAHGFISTVQLKALSWSLSKENTFYMWLTNYLKKHLAATYSKATVQEWIDENIYEQQRHIVETTKKIYSLPQPKSMVTYSSPLPLHDAGKKKISGVSRMNQNGSIINSETEISFHDASKEARDQFHNTSVQDVTNQTNQNLPIKPLSTFLSQN